MQYCFILLLAFESVLVFSYPPRSSTAGTQIVGNKISNSEAELGSVLLPRTGSDLSRSRTQSLASIPEAFDNSIGKESLEFASEDRQQVGDGTRSQIPTANFLQQQGKSLDGYKSQASTIDAKSSKRKSTFRQDGKKNTLPSRQKAQRLDGKEEQRLVHSKDVLKRRTREPRAKASTLARKRHKDSSPGQSEKGKAFQQTYKEYVPPEQKEMQRASSRISREKRRQHINARKSELRQEPEGLRAHQETHGERVLSEQQEILQRERARLLRASRKFQLDTHRRNKSQQLKIKNQQITKTSSAGAREIQTTPIDREKYRGAQVKRKSRLDNASSTDGTSTEKSSVSSDRYDSTQPTSRRTRERSSDSVSISSLSADHRANERPAGLAGTSSYNDFGYQDLMGSHSPLPLWYTTPTRSEGTLSDILGSNIPSPELGRGRAPSENTIRNALNSFWDD